ncbi:MAG: hypothetical protein DGJ47_000842 [Rickettsiaceae bacterium]
MILSVIKVLNQFNRNASIKFDISPNTVRNWYKRYKKEGNYLAKKVGGKKGRVTSEEIASYIKNYQKVMIWIYL